MERPSHRHRLPVPPVLLLGCALAVSFRAPAEEPSFARLLQEGTGLYESRRYFDAAVAFRAALPRAPEGEEARVRELLARALGAHGVELFNAGETRAAEKVFAEALEAFPDFYAHFGLGLLHLSRLEDQEARDHLHRSLRLQPGFARAHKLLALLAYREGRTEEARRSIEEAARLDASDAEIRTLRDRWLNEASHVADFEEIRADGVTLRLDPAIGSARGAAVLARARALRAELAEAFLVERPRPLVMVVFSSEKFHRATGSYHWVGGLYDGQLKLPLPEKGDDDEAADGQGAEDPLEVALRHELAHAFIRELSALCPNWLNEGIAQYFEAPAGRRGHRAEAVRRTLLAEPAERVRFRDVPVRLWELDDAALARRTYLQGLGFVHFLVDRGHEFRLVLLLEAIRREGSVAEAFRAVYGEPLESLEDAWWDEILGSPRAAGR